MIDPQWTAKLAQGRKVEESILLWYRENIDPTAHFPKVPSKWFDIVCVKVGNVEVKEDRLAHSTGFYAFETQNYDGSPSGVMGTEAQEFVLVDYDNVIFSTSENIRYLLAQSERKKRINMGFRTAEGRQCQGWLLPKTELLYSPFVSVEPRWFPHWRYINGRITA